MKKRITAILLALIGLAALLAGCAREKTTICLNDYAMFCETGTDGFGTLVNLELNRERLRQDYAAVFENADVGEELFFAVLPALAPSEQWREPIENQTLCNGDQIDFHWEENQAEDLEKLFNVELVYFDFTYTVTGLRQVEEVDPFACTRLTLRGRHGEGCVATFGWAYVETSQGLERMDLTVKPPANNGALRNGDLAHVSLSVDMDARELAERYGVRLTRTEADVEIFGFHGDPSFVRGEPAVVNLNEFLRFSSYVFDGDGAVQVRIDYNGLLGKCSRYLCTDVTEEDMLGQWSLDDAADYCIRNMAPFTLVCSSHSSARDGILLNIPSDYFSSASGIRNGDEIKFTWVVDQEAMESLKKLLNVEFRFEDYTYTVEGLSPMEPVDPFADYRIYYDGTNGSGYAYGYFRLEEPDVELAFEVVSDRNGSLRNGDTITLALGSNNAFNFRNWGLEPVRTEIEVVVSGLAD